MVEKRGAVAMIYDFDKVIDRRNTFAVKWDGINFFTDPMNEDTIPMMIADMDLPCPEPVVQAMHRVADNRMPMPFAVGSVTVTAGRSNRRKLLVLTAPSAH